MDGAYRLEKRLKANRIGPGRYRVVAADGRQRIVYIAGPREKPTVFFDGQAYELQAGAFAAKGSRPGADHSLEAPMPATVVQIVAEIGSRVAAGDTLLTLEAMKMQLPIRSPRDGVVSAIHCRVGELVQPGVQLIDIT